MAAVVVSGAGMAGGKMVWQEGYRRKTFGLCFHGWRCFAGMSWNKYIKRSKTKEKYNTG